jgi:hypothetical protein
MTSCKSESVILIPMLEREVTERSCVGKFQVGEMPIDDLKNKNEDILRDNVYYNFV